MYLLRHIGAPRHATLLPWRLVISLLNEDMNYINIIGALFVILIVFAYLWKQQQIKSDKLAATTECNKYHN